MAFLRNAWYVAALSAEIGRSLLARTILGESVLLYRKEDGAAVAIGNVCPHRFAPLELGRLVGDAVECHYHGLRFDASGACVFNPFGEGTIPANAKVKTYALIERKHLLWIWMGETEPADPAKIPSFPHLASPQYRTLAGMARMEANYQLAADNLLDPSHSQFVHGDYLATDLFLASQYEMVNEGTSVESNYWSPRQKGPPHFMRFFPDPDILVDHWTRVKWTPPSSFVVDVGVMPTGRPPDEGIRQLGTHLITPETDRSSFYFYLHSRNFQLDDPQTDARTREWQRVGVAEQDRKVMEAVQRFMPETDLLALHPVLMKQDVAAVRARRIMAQLIAAERDAAASSPASEARGRA